MSLISSEPIQYEILDDIQIEDLPKLDSASDDKFNQIKSLSHRVAQLKAVGKSIHEISLHTGRSPAWIQSHLNAPAMKELISFYENHTDVLSRDILDGIKTLSTMALDELLSRLFENPEQFTAKDLREIMEAGLDRSGHGKTSTLSVNHGLSTDAIRAIKESASGIGVKVIDGSEKEEEEISPPALEDRSDQESVASCPDIEYEVISGEGDSV